MSNSELVKYRDDFIDTPQQRFIRYINDMQPAEKTPTRLAAEKAAEGLRLQLVDFEQDINSILQKPHCLIYLVGFCIGVVDGEERRTGEEVNTKEASEGGIIWAIGEADLSEYSKGNRIAIDAYQLFANYQGGNAPELQPVYELAIKEGQSYASGEGTPEWLRTFINDGLNMEAGK